MKRRRAIAIRLRDAVRPLGAARPQDSARAGDSGQAILEVLVLGIVVLLPVGYILVCLLRIQALTLAANQAARDAGRAMDGAVTAAAGAAQAEQITRLTLDDQGLRQERFTLAFVATGAPCDGPQQPPSVEPGATYDVCVRVVYTLPWVPAGLSGSGNTVTGVYTVHVGELREGGR